MALRVCYMWDCYSWYLLFDCLACLCCCKSGNVSSLALWINRFSSSLSMTSWFLGCQFSRLKVMGCWSGLCLIISLRAIIPVKLSWFRTSSNSCCRLILFFRNLMIERAWNLSHRQGSDPIPLMVLLWFISFLLLNLTPSSLAFFTQVPSLTPSSSKVVSCSSLTYATLKQTNFPQAFWSGLPSVIVNGFYLLKSLAWIHDPHQWCQNRIFSMLVWSLSMFWLSPCSC